MPLFTSSPFLLFLITLAPSLVMSNNVCRPNEIAIGTDVLCNLGSPSSPGACDYTATLWSDTCETLDYSDYSNSAICVGGWARGSIINCVPGEDMAVWNIWWHGSDRFGSYPESSNAGCYKPSSPQDCGATLWGSAPVYWCCPRV